MATYFNPIGEFLSLYQPQGLVSLVFSNGDNQPPTGFNFADGTSNDTKTTVANAAASFDWQSLSMPDTQSFINACAGDNSLADVALVLTPFTGLVPHYNANPSLMKNLWAQLVAGGQITSIQQSTIEAYASNFNMPLV